MSTINQIKQWQKIILKQRIILLQEESLLQKTSSKVKEVLRKQSKSATIYLTFPFFSFILSLPHEILRQPLPGQSSV